MFVYNINSFVYKKNFKLIYFLDWTQDIDKKTLVDLINENPSTKWDKIKIETNIKIYKKKVIINFKEYLIIDRK